MSTKTKQKKMSDFVSTTESTKKQATDTAYSSEPKRAKFGQVDLSSIDFSCNKKNAKGKSYNLKIMTWNVAGLRAWIKKNVIEYLETENPDIICLQETKCTEKQLPPDAKLKGYTIYAHSAEQAGYSGVAMYTKKKPISVRMGKQIKEMNDTEGRIIEAEFEQFYLVSTYVPNSGLRLISMPKRMKWDDEFQKYLKLLDSKKPVILAGDLNVAHEEIDIANPQSNTRNPGFTQEERDNLSKMLKLGFVDTFRMLYPTRTQAYTFWTYFATARARNIGWRLDYFILSKRFTDIVCDNVIRTHVMGSDHCPVVLFAHV